MATVTRRPIHQIMYSEGDYDVLFLQPTLYQRWFAHEQNEVFLTYQQVIDGHAALMNDLGTEPNHGILQLAAILMQDGLRVDVLDFHVLDIVFRRDGRLVDEADIRDVLARKRAGVFGISSKIISANRAFQLARIVKELHPDSTVLIGGVHPTFQAPEILDTCPAIDVVARGESDHTIRGGESIAPAEIEEVLLGHPAVAEACVVGLPDEEWGQRIVAVVVPRPGPAPTGQELRDHARTHLRGSKTREAVELWTALPHTDTGKLLRRLVLQQLLDDDHPVDADRRVLTGP